MLFGKLGFVEKKTQFCLIMMIYKILINMYFIQWRTAGVYYINMWSIFRWKPPKDSCKFPI